LKRLFNVHFGGQHALMVQIEEIMYYTIIKINVCVFKLINTII